MCNWLDLRTHLTFYFPLFENFVFVPIPFSSAMRKYRFPPPRKSAFKQLMAPELEKRMKSFLPGYVTVYHAIFKSFPLRFSRAKRTKSFFFVKH